MKSAHISFRPSTPSGWTAAIVLGVGILLLVARITLTPVLRLPLSYLVVIATVALAGLVGAYAVTVRHERSLAAIGALAIGLSACVLLVAEAITSP